MSTNNDYIKTIGKRLKDERRSKTNLNQEDFGKLGGVSLSAQRAYEAGRSSPTAEYLSKISDLIDIAYVIKGEKNAEESNEVYEDPLTYIKEDTNKDVDKIVERKEACFNMAFKFAQTKGLHGELEFLKAAITWLYQENKEYEDLVAYFDDLNVKSKYK